MANPFIKIAIHHVAHQMYAQPSDRPFGEIQVGVRRRYFKEVERNAIITDLDGNGRGLVSDLDFNDVNALIPESIGNDVVQQLVEDGVELSSDGIRKAVFTGKFVEFAVHALNFSIPVLHSQFKS